MLLALNDAMELNGNGALAELFRNDVLVTRGTAPAGDRLPPDATGVRVDGADVFVSTVRRVSSEDGGAGGDGRAGTEVRLVAMPWTERAAEVMRKEGHQPAPLKEVYKTSRDGRERRHISLFGKDFAPLPLQRVIVGPSRSQDANATFARKIVGGKIPVSKSATPYIG